MDEAAAAAPKKGVALKPKKAIQKPPPELAVAAAAPDPLSVKPEPMPKREVAAPPAAPRGRSLFGAKEVVKKEVVKKVAKPKPVVADEAAAEAAAAPVEEALAKEGAAEAAPAPKKFAFRKPLTPEQRFSSEDDEALFHDIRDEITEEKDGNPYLDAAGPPAFVPQTRRAFRGFIRNTYKKFILGPMAMPTEPGDKYPYQKFVREYMRQDSPYRGLLVYHGLGSGKTCTAIAAAEALFSTANKKIIVMAPASLKNNFFDEISKCGFRHFRLANVWVKFPAANPEVATFAKEILNLPESFVRRTANIWMPDLGQPETESNYKTLPTAEQAEIRAQIVASLVWDPVKNPTGRIRFIGYNGITSKRLKNIVCEENDFFDDAVIIIDEVHNVVRLMQGNLEPYLTSLKGLKRRVPFQPITMDKWKPPICTTQFTGTPEERKMAEAKAVKQYARGYYMYRLLVQARNSKIIGLSGTPLINFPEELGILMNILHGYTPLIRASVVNADQSMPDVEGLRAVLEEIPYLDFIEVVNDPTKRLAGEGEGATVTVTFLEVGLRKVEGGVERIPEDEERPTYQEIAAMVSKVLTENKYRYSGKDPELQAIPLLPPTGEEFREKFVNFAGVQRAEGAGAAGVDPTKPFEDPILTNKLVLVKRISGMISYYRGSRADLMPAVAEDTVVRVPMGPYAQRMYAERRSGEIAMEKKPKAKEGGLTGVWAEVYDVGKSKQTSNYKMASRQACNFVFPPEVVRPMPNTPEEELAEAQGGHAGTEDLMDTAPDGEPATEPGLELALEDTAEAEEAEAAAEDAEADAEGALAEADAEGAAEAPAAEGPVPDGQEGGGKEDEEEDAKEAAALAPAPAPEPELKKKFAFKTALKAKAAALAPAAPSIAKCKAGQEKGQTYKDACIVAKECLATTFSNTLLLDKDPGLETYSPKFAEMLRRIEAAPGSSLVYSQFLDMEGIGIFRLAMEVNGYIPIEIASGAGGLQFSARTLESFRPGPDGAPKPVNRFITFSGSEDQDVRRAALAIFNANFNVLPENLKKILVESGYTNNHKGEICRVFCITRAGAEGLSLKCVRAVHIMEPYWNEALLTQVKGRAIRIGSHLELPEEDRNVSIFTYLTTFSEEAQVQRAGDGRIDETIRNSDAIERKDAVALGLPIPEGAATYVLTTDERLFAIAERKRLITTSLERVMKSAAVDCQLNLPENNVESDPVQCLGLEGAVGDFLFHPILEMDIAESESSFKGKAAVDAAPAEAADAAPAEEPEVAPRRMVALAPPKPAPAAAKPAPAPAAKPAAPVAKPLPPGTLKKAFKGKQYLMVPKPKADGTISGFELYDINDTSLKKLLGISGAKGDQPAPPVEFMT
jgi:hypothetical protein